MKHFLIGLMFAGMVNICHGAELSEQKKLEYAMQYACDSFKQELNFSSPYIEFDSCYINEMADVKPNPLIIKYRVKGKFAEKIEKQLHEEYKVPLFKKQQYVALWETGAYYQNSVPNYVVDISFFSVETLVQERKDWHKIPYFNLWFEKMPSP